MTKTVDQIDQDIAQAGISMRSGGIGWVPLTWDEFALWMAAKNDDEGYEWPGGWPNDHDPVTLANGARLVRWVPNALYQSSATCWTWGEFKRGASDPDDDESEEIDHEDQALIEVIKAARTIQNYLWGETDGGYGIEEWRRMFRKRLIKLEQIDQSNPHAAIEMRKRLLQIGALAVALMGSISKNGIKWDPDPDGPPSNLPEYSKPTTE